MKILIIHSDFIEFKPTQKALKNAEDVDKVKKRFEECLVAFISTEEKDEPNLDKVFKNAAEEIIKVSNEVKTKKVVLYPYVHLSQSPSKPAYAKRAMDEIEKILKNEKYDVNQAPFGWYKAFTISCKGHPLSELSRDINFDSGKSGKSEDDVSGSLKEEETVKSTWFIMTPEGKLEDAEKFNFKGHENLKKFYKYESQKNRIYNKEPPHIKFMRSLELVDYEPASDSGHFRYYPKGRLVKSLLEEWVTQKVIDYGAMEVETPIMYDYEHPALKSYLHRFPARQYIVQSLKKQYFLRFSACFGQFLMKNNMTISYRSMPLKMYELTKYSFRLEKSGELVGLKRLRCFTMPDMHTLCMDIEQAKEEFISQFRLCMECLKEVEIDNYETGIRLTEGFWKEKGNKAFIENMAKEFKRPVLIEMFNKRYAYFDPKFEFNVIDSSDKATALSTVQLDHENCERYGIKYTDTDNTRKTPLVLHCSPPGAIERVMFAMLEKVANDKSPMLPVWLSPTQVRLCPMNDSIIEHCEKLSEQLEKSNIRVDIDDRTESVQKKIRDSEHEWIPYAVVIGEKEIQSEKLAVRYRKTGKIEQISVEALVKKLNDECRGKPFKKLSLSKYLTKRPTFL